MHFQTQPRVEDATLDRLDALIVPVFDDGSAPEPLPDDLRRMAAWVHAQTGRTKLFTPTTHLRETAGGALRLVVVNAGQREEYDVERARNVVAAGVRALWRSDARHVAVVLDTGRLSAAAATRAAVEGVHFSMWRPETHRTAEEDRRLPPLEEVTLVGRGDQAAIEPAAIVGEAVNWARQLANEPANMLTPTRLADEARALAERAGVECEVLDEEACAGLGMHSFLAVARGSAEPARFVALRYYGRPDAKGAGDGYDLALVGKGITFDSGGISIKPADEMHLMKMDMSGAAAVIAAGGAIARLGLPINLICAAPCTENLPGGRATKPGDVVTSMSGKTVEVINTDAEGRLVLIDGVTYVQREGARRVVDVATLTGAVRIALGLYYAGLFGKPDSFVEQLRRAGAAAGERLWPLPISDEYRSDMQSELADLRNSHTRLGGAIKGAAFVEAVVDDGTEWAHLDIAGSAWLDEERPFSPKGPQGASVRALIELARSLAG